MHERMHFPEFSIERWKCVSIFPEEISKTTSLVWCIEFVRSHSPIQVWNVRTLNGSRHFKSICLHNFAEERTGIHIRLHIRAQGDGAGGVKKWSLVFRLRCICQPRNIFVNLSESAHWNISP